MCTARRLLPVQPVYFTSSHWETRSDQARARTGSPVSRLFVPITMATLCKRRSGCSSRSQTIFPAAGSHMNSAVHVPPSPLSACAPLHRKAALSPSLAATEPLPQAGGQLAAWQTLHYSHQLKHFPARAPGCAGTSMETLCLASRESQESPKHSSQGLGGQILPWVGTATPIWTFQRAKAKLAAGFHKGGAGHLHAGSPVCYGTSREATGPEAWQGNGCASPAQ